MQFTKRLETIVSKTGTSLCVGIDPHINMVPEFIDHMIEDKGVYYFLEWYGEGLLDIARELGLPAVKFQSAFFESHGSDGVKVMINLLIKCRGMNLISILDAKRGDVSSTMEAYGQSAFEVIGADALTINPYMGFDVIRPLEKWLNQGKGVYVVLVSSNPSGPQVQSLECGNSNRVSDVIFEIIEEMSDKLGFNESVGYVLGATKVDELSETSFSKFESKPLLIPGVGAQGAVADGVRMTSLLRSKKHLIPISRGIAGFGANFEDKEVNELSENKYFEFVKIKAKRYREALKLHIDQ